MSFLIPSPLPLNGGGRNIRNNLGFNAIQRKKLNIPVSKVTTESLRRGQQKLNKLHKDVIYSWLDVLDCITPSKL